MKVITNNSVFGHIRAAVFKVLIGVLAMVPSVACAQQPGTWDWFKGYGDHDGSMLQDQGQYFFGGYSNAGQNQQWLKQWRFYLGDWFGIGTSTAISVFEVQTPGMPISYRIKVTNYLVNCTGTLTTGEITVGDLCTSGPYATPVLTWINTLPFPVNPSSQNTPYIITDHGTDYDLFAYRLDASNDIVLDNFIGTEYAEGDGFGHMACYFPMSKSGNDHYVFGCTRQEFVGGHGESFVTKVNYGLQPQWTVSLNRTENARLSQVLGLVDNRVLVHALEGWGPSSLFWLNSDGSYFTGAEYTVDNSDRIFIRNFLQDPASGNDIIAVGAVKGGSGDYQMILLRIDELSGSVISFQAFSLAGEDIIANRIVKVSTGKYVILGYLDDGSPGGAGRDGFYAEFDGNFQANGISSQVTMAGWDQYWDAVRAPNGSTWILGQGNLFNVPSEGDNPYVIQLSATGLFVKAYDYVWDEKQVAKSMFSHFNGGWMVEGSGSNNNVLARLSLILNSSGEGPKCITRPVEPVLSTLSLTPEDVTVQWETLENVDIEYHTPIEDTEIGTKEPIGCEDCNCDLEN